MKLTSGSEIGHYKILSPIGKGGMGEVYLAEDTKLDRKIALKILPELYASDAERMYRFYQEARAASRLNHPNIITIYEFGETEDLHYISSEFIKGKSLNKCLKGESLKLKETLEIAIQIASALDIAHSNGIVHRDIKPQNIMIRPDGLVKVLDFGIAKLLENREEWESGSEGGGESGREGVREGASEKGNENETLISPSPSPPLSVPPSPSLPPSPRPPVSPSSQTSPGTVLGTAAYMSPEQARGTDVDARSDIFSFGIILYEMVSGRLPFWGENELDMIASILHKEPKPLHQISENIPPEIGMIIHRALQKHKDERYQTVKNLLRDLKEVKQELEFQNRLDQTMSPDPDEPQTKPIQPATINEGKQPASGITNLFEQARQHKVFSAIIAGFIILGVILSVTYLSTSSYIQPVNNEPINSLAILPFTNAGGGADNEYLSDGLTESIIYNLSNLNKLRVLPGSTVFKYKGKKIDPQKIGEELNVRAVLVSRIVQRGNSLLISTELIDTAQNKIIWGERYDRKISDALDLQKEISTEISERLRLKLSGAEEKKVARDYTTDGEAYQAYLRGRFQWNKRNETSLKKGIEYFDQAIDLDPNYAIAWSGLADCYILLPEYSTVPPKEAMPKGKAAAKKAIQLDPDLAEAHTSLAYVLTSYEWKFAEAEKEFERAIKLNPEYATAHQWYGLLLEITGRHDEAIKRGRRALELEPLSQIVNFSTGYRYLHARKYEEAVKQFKRSLELYPNFAPGHRRLGFALAHLDKYGEAIKELEKAEKISGFSSQGAIAYVQALSGKKEPARKILEQELKSPKKDVRDIAITYIRLGEKDKAFKWLETLYQQRDDRILYLTTSPFYDDIRDEPQYKDLVKRIGLEK